MVLLLLIVAGLFEKREKRKRAQCENEGEFIESSAMSHQDELESAFGSLVSEIMWDTLRDRRKSRGTKKEVGTKFGVEAAFLEAVKEINLAESRRACCDETTLLKRIQDLGKKYKNQTP